MTIAELLARYEPEFRRAFLAGVVEVRDKARIADITRALERGDVQAALDAMFVERAAYREFEREIQSAFDDGGSAGIDELGPLRDQQNNRIVFRFAARDLQAERIIREHSSELVTRIVEDQRQAVRAALEDNLSRGVNPRTSALDIVGRVDRATQRRTGGILGLSAPQEQYVRNARTELTEGDYTAYLTRERRDRRFDSIVRRAQREERPLTQTEISRLTGRYSDRLLALRGETIARTETLTSLRMGQWEGYRQLADSGRVPRNAIRLVWKATRDTRTRFSHANLDGESIGIDEAFTTLRGARLRFPGDPQGGAAEVVNCRCALRADIQYQRNR